MNDWLILHGPAIVWTLVCIVGAVLHKRAYGDYSQQVREAREEVERIMGPVIAASHVADTGLILVAVNQRLRYIIRFIFAINGLAIGIISFLPPLAKHPLYGFYVLGYIVLTEGATTYLTWRDLRLLRSLRR